MSIDSTLQNLGVFYTWMDLIGLLVLLLGCIIGIILVWVLKWNTKDATGKEISPETIKQSKIIYTIILSASIIIIPIIAYVFYHFRKNKSFQEGMGLTGTANTISNMFRI